MSKLALFPPLGSPTRTFKIFSIITNAMAFVIFFGNLVTLGFYLLATFLRKIMVRDTMSSEL